MQRDGQSTCHEVSRIKSGKAGQEKCAGIKIAEPAAVKREGNHESAKHEKYIHTKMSAGGDKPQERFFSSIEVMQTHKQCRYSAQHIQMQ
jgi:hypothetical protein